VVIPIIATAALVGCQRQVPSATYTADRVAEITEVNTAGEYVDTVALAPDGSRVAIAERSGPVKVWALPDPTDPVTLGQRRQGVADLAIVPDGSVLVSLVRHGDGTLRFWQPGGAGVWTETAVMPVGRCLALRFDRSGARLAVLCEREVLLVDVAARREMARFPHADPELLTAFDLSASGSTLLTAGHGGDVTVWDVGTNQPARTFSVKRSRRPGPPPRGLDPEPAWAVAVALSPDGGRAAAATIEGSLYAWDVSTGAELLARADAEAAGPPSGSLRFVTAGRLLAVTGDRRGMRLVDLSPPASQVVMSGMKSFHAVSISDDARTFAILTSTIVRRGLIYGVEVWRTRPR
jgi:WD40 repeat protein